MRNLPCLVTICYTLPQISLHIANYHPPASLPPVAPVICSYKRLKARAKQHLHVDRDSDPATKYYPYPLAVHPHLIIVL